eukprot:TRINITY_DN49_c0_g1_i1.p1 TRINITY_DN49_c0_g1~~TRINITY_DN49_c0_g1_i1.p1  ORF type:complete len:214 (-),score=66.91 TRINITY_DN49_c0_g1_i1:94-735(-)
MATTEPEPQTSAPASETAPQAEKPTEVRIEDVSDDNDVPNLVDATAAAAAPEQAGAAEADDDAKGKHTRSEKKCRKAVSKLGMKAVPGIIRVTVKKSKNILFVISKPDVFKSPTSETYVIFGEAKVDDMGQAAAQAAASRQFGEAKETVQPKPQAPQASVEEVSTSTETEDETGLEPKDIELVMTQTGASRAKAVRTLRKTGGDIVSAIMELS